MTNEERIEMLKEAQDMLREAAALIRDAVHSTGIENTAHAYLFPSIEMAIDDEHEWLGSNGLTVQDAIGAIEEDIADGFEY